MVVPHRNVEGKITHVSRHYTPTNDGVPRFGRDRPKQQRQKAHRMHIAVIANENPVVFRLVPRFRVFLVQEQ